MFYTGITQRGIGKRFGDYLLRRGKGFVNSRCKNFKRIPVYVEYLYGNEFEAMKRERYIKNLSKDRKRVLIGSDKNMLVNYIVLKGFVLKKCGCLDECIYVKIS